MSKQSPPKSQRGTGAKGLPPGEEHQHPPMVTAVSEAMARCPPMVKRLPRALDPMRRTLRPTSRGKIIGHSPLLRGLMDVIDRIAPTDCTVLVTGETGTGKEAVVAAIHDCSPRRLGPLATVNCGALPSELIESELFGHERGAFTGATSTQTGRVAEAEGGTLFLDEIAELPLALQVKILRLLQHREYRPVGASRERLCNLRFIAATNRDLQEAVAQGTFRADLFYRVNVVRVHVPALRERKEDLGLLAEHFFRAALELCGRTDLEGFSPAALAVLREHDWPGNVRELENVVHRAVLLSPGPTIDAPEMKAHVGGGQGGAELVRVLPESGFRLRAAVRAYERSLILQALERTGWNRSRAAELLGLHRTTLLDMIRRMALVE